MSVEPRDERAERNKNIVEDFIHGGMSKAALATKYKISAKHIYNILRDAGVDEKDRKVPVKRNTDVDKRPITMLHAQIGAMVSNYRVFELEMGIDQLANRLGMTRHRLADIERGLHDLDLSDLQALSKEMDKPVHEMLKPRFAEA